MKYNLNKRLTKRLSKRFKRHKAKDNAKLKKKKLLKEEQITPILSPYNSTEYLMKNQSSPFYDEDEDDFMFQENDLIDLVNDLKETKDNELSIDKLDSTLDESEIINSPFGEFTKKSGEIAELQKK